ncbi:MAG: homoserine kinase [Gemmatimonadota bacterium]
MSNAPSELRAVTAFAPASVANVSVGFDLLGFAIGGAGDRVTIRPAPDRSGVRITAQRGVVTSLPSDPARNTATVALHALLAEQPLPFGLDVEIDKGIPLGSGMGGSAASAVAAVVAANAFLPTPASSDDLLRWATVGEAAASGAQHADNVAPCLLGGLTAVVGMDPPRAIALPVPPGLECVVIHPHLQIETRRARAAMRAEVPLHDHVRQSMHLAGFVAACYTGDAMLLGRSVVDLVAEPARAPLIPGFHDARVAAEAAGALAFGISGSGPTVFALTADPAVTARVEEAVLHVFEAGGVAADPWSGPVGQPGAHVLDAIEAA